MEYLPNGNLHGYLNKIRTGQTTDSRQHEGQVRGQMNKGNVPSNDLLTFAVQIARGMDFLASKAVRVQTFTH